MGTPLNQYQSRPSLTSAERNLLYGLTQFTFMQDDLAASQTDVQLLVSEVASAAGNTVNGLVMPFSGSIMAITARLSAAGSAGTLIVSPTIEGVKAATPKLYVSTAQSPVARAARGAAAFGAGALLGASITTDGSWNGTTSDLAVTVFVAFDLF